MSMVVVLVGKVKILLQLKPWLNTLTLRLYKNNVFPSQSDTVSTYTEADFAGYVPVVMNSWGVPFINASNKGEIDHPIVEFTQVSSTPSSNVYGYYVTDPAGNLIWAERYSGAPFDMNAEGLTFTVAPILTDDDMP